MATWIGLGLLAVVAGLLLWIITGMEHLSRQLSAIHIILLATEAARQRKERGEDTAGPRFTARPPQEP